MTRVAWMGAIAASTVLASSPVCAAAEQAAAVAQSPTKASPATEQPAGSRFDRNAKVCKKVTYTGSRLGTARICKKRSEWADRSFTDQKQTELIQHNTMPHISR